MTFDPLASSSTGMCKSGGSLIDKPISNLIFDMDGTLIDSMDTHAAAFAEIAGRTSDVGFAALRNIYTETAGMPLDSQFHLALATAETGHEPSVRTMIEEFWEVVSREPPIVYPHVDEVLIRLRNEGFAMFVSSGCAPSVVAEKMKHADLARHFLLMLGTVYDDSATSFGKGPEHFSVIRQRLGATAEEFQLSTAMIGDSRYDMQIARQARMRAIGAAIGSYGDELRFAGAEAVFHDWREFPRIISLLPPHN